MLPFDTLVKKLCFCESAYLKHEYLRSCACRCLSLSSFLFPVVIQNHFFFQSLFKLCTSLLSRYSCLHLGSRIQEFFNFYNLQFFKKSAASCSQTHFSCTNKSSKMHPFCAFQHFKLTLLKIFKSSMMPHFLKMHIY